jgi:pectate lyase
MKYSGKPLISLSILLGLCLQLRAAFVVHDTWQDGTRTDPAAPTYSENGFDSDQDGDIESAWYVSTGSSLSVTPGHFVTTIGTGSLSWTTYFTPEASPITLSSAGDSIRVTWVFTPNGVSSASTTSSGVRLALADSPSSARLASDTSPPKSTYAGYGMFMNMATTFGATPFNLVDRATPGTSDDLLASAGAWTTVASSGTSGHTGYASGTQYTFVMTLTRNASSGLDIVATMTGGNLNGTGGLTNSFTDSTPNTFTFDTFGLRPGKASDSATSFDTTLFSAEFIPGATPPSIDLDPQPQSALVGDDVLFKVQASGTAPLAYQWYFNTNTPILNGTNSILSLTNVQLSDGGYYSVVVTNSYLPPATSAPALLTVTTPIAPSITTQPQDQTNISPGGTASFNVIAGGSEPFSYQWYFNGTNVLTNATDATLTLNNVQAANAGLYSVTISNVAGGVLSSNAVLTLNTNPVPPVFISQPASLVVLSGSTVSFSATAAGTAPIYYQWNKNGVPISGATSTTLTLTNVQPTNNGSYTLTASNQVSSVTSDPAQLTVTLSVPIVSSAYNLVGFAQGTTGGGVIPETDPAYRKVTNALDLANAILSAYKTAGSVKVIEVMNDMDLGWNEVGSAVQTLASTPFRSHNTPLLHPRLLITGVSLIDIKPKSGLTIFSANGATIRHATFNIKSTGNIIVRNLKFDEMWEWDESTKGNYDKNDWDFIDLGNGGAVTNIWIDHCTFTKSYDGIVDTKAGSSKITLSWCRYTGDDGATNTNSFVWQQINKLESNKTSYAFYNFLRTRGFSPTDIVTIIQGHDKTHLAGANDLDSGNATLSFTFHHQWFQNVWDRCVPRLRAGNVHDFNIYVDDTLALAARRLRDAKAAALSTADQNTLNNTYSFRPPLNGSISTESGAILVEKSVYINCLWPLRNNQTDPSNSVYTGKILGTDTIYQFDSTFVRGNSTDPGNPLGPFQAPIIPFSWNLSGNQLPYSYSTDDPSQLQTIVTSPTSGAGAGVLTWNKTNWLRTSYPATAPSVATDPQNQTVTVGGTANFSVLSGGTIPFTYQWRFNTNTPISNATNAFLTITNVQTTNAGTYSVVISNSAGSVTSAFAVLTVVSPNSPPSLAPVPDTNIVARATLYVTNSATDPDSGQTLAFGLLNPPANATINSNSGLFAWRPSISQANTSFPISVTVADNGSPSLSATQTFNVFVSTPANPQVTSSGFANGLFQLTINGDAGPDYIVNVSSNLTDWSSVFTNLSPTLPLIWNDPDSTNFSQRFYRIQVGP